MDLVETIKWGEKKLKLFVLFWGRIVFAPDHFHTPLLTRLRANFSGGFLADQWMLYGLDGKKRKDYISEFDWYRSRYINEPFDFMLNNKIVATEAFGRYIRMPRIYAINSHGHTTGPDGELLDEAQLLALLREKEDTVIKPYGRGKGLGVHRLGYTGGSYTIDGSVVAEEELRRHLAGRKNWYLTETIHQHPYADALYDRTVNTLRVITLRDPDSGEFKVFFAVQRVGTHRTVPVDNASQGGLVCRVDLETGRLSEARSLHELTVYQQHPDSGQRFEDVVVPGWAELKEELLALARRFPYLSFVAWDVVKLPDGQNCVIEANTSSGVNIIQLWGGQRHGELGDFYRYHHVIR